MEYIISTKEFPQSKRVSGNIYISNDFSEIVNISKDGNLILIKDGFTIPNNSLNSYEISDYINVLGCFNIIKINIKYQVIEVISDKRTIIPIYLYKNGSDFGLSNNPWLLAKIFANDIEIDEKSLLSQLVYWVDVDPDRTLIKNLRRIKAGDQITYDVENKIFTFKSNYNFKYTPNESISLRDELEMADEQFTFYFKYIKEQNQGKTAGFGCSGGLDSRLIAHYTNKVGLNPEYYVIGDPYPNKLFKSVTSIVSKKVAEYYHHDIKQISYNISWLEKSLMLDIRNHPFFFAQLFLNPIFELPNYDYQIVGDPGAYAYMADYVMSGNLELLKIHADFFLGLRKDSHWGMSDKFRKVVGHLGMNVNKYSDEGLFGLKKSMIDHNIDSQIIKDAKHEFYDKIDKAPGNNNVEKWIYIHDFITTRYQYASAYDSMNLKKKCYPLYYPFFYEQMKHFPLSFFDNKYFLKKLLLQVNPDYANIPDQNFNFIDRQNSLFQQIINRVELALRGRGLQIRDLMKNSVYKDLFKKVYNRKNPIFDRYVNVSKIMNSKLPFTYAGSQLLKLKMVIDYIYYKDFDILLQIKDFKIK